MAYNEGNALGQCVVRVAKPQSGRPFNGDESACRRTARIVGPLGLPVGGATGVRYTRRSADGKAQRRELTSIRNQQPA